MVKKKLFIFQTAKTPGGNTNISPTLNLNMLMSSFTFMICRIYNSWRMALLFCLVWFYLPSMIFFNAYHNIQVAWQILHNLMCHYGLSGAYFEHILLNSVGSTDKLFITCILVCHGWDSNWQPFAWLRLHCNWLGSKMPDDDINEIYEMFVPTIHVFALKYT